MSETVLTVNKAGLKGLNHKMSIFFTKDHQIIYFAIFFPSDSLIHIINIKDHVH